MKYQIRLRPFLARRAVNARSIRSVLSSAYKLETLKADSPIVRDFLRFEINGQIQP